ncbi:MAG: metalloregulator ArsR/SmtB family transcription factor [Pseudomonadota bacterium]
MSDQLDIEQMQRGAEAATAMLRVLANRDRLMLMCQLSQGELCVSELEEQLAIRQPTLSQQLGILREQGLVATRRDGKKIYYSVGDERAIALLGVLYSLYCPAPRQTAARGA